MPVLTFRIPGDWSEKVDSRKVRRWLVTYLKNPFPLPQDPGAGKLRISISLPAQLMKTVRTAREDSPSGALRRIIAANIGSPQKQGTIPGRLSQDSSTTKEVESHSLVQIETEKSRFLPMTLGSVGANVAQEQACHFNGLRLSEGFGQRESGVQTAPRFSRLPSEPHKNNVLELKEKQTLITAVVVLAFIVWLTWNALKSGRTPLNTALGTIS